MKPKNEKLGEWLCAAGGKADVYQTKKLGRHFYTHCDCCGLNQGTGAARQQKIFEEADFINPAAIVVPSNVKVGGVVSSVPSEQVEKEVPKSLDFDPSEPVEKQEESAKSFPASKLIAGVVMLLAAGAGVWMN